MINYTVAAQRSFDNTWAASPLHTLPSGIILDLSLSIPVSATPTNESLVYLTSTRVHRGELTLIFRDAKGGLIAEVTTSVTSVPVALNGYNGVIGTILIGRIPDKDGELVSESITVNPVLVRRYYDITATATQRVTVRVDDNEIMNEELEQDVVLLGGTEISISNSNGTATVNRINEVGVTTDYSTKAADKYIYRINNKEPDSNGVLHLSVSCISGSISVSNSLKGYAVIDSTDNVIVTLLKPEDIIDKHIAPSAGRDYGYYPLDDAYVVGSAVASNRNVVSNLSEVTAIASVSPVDSAFDVTTNTVGIDNAVVIYDSTSSSTSTSSSILTPTVSGTDYR